MLEAAWRAEALGIEMTPYACVPTSIGAGFVEVVTPALTTASIATQAGHGALGALRSTPLRDWLAMCARSRHVPFADVVANFTGSCAGYAVATHVLGVGDRHNDNIMVRRSGHLLHIDFGHFSAVRDKRSSAIGHLNFHSKQFETAT